MDLEYFLKQYAPFETQTAVGKVKFVGKVKLLPLQLSTVCLPNGHGVCFQKHRQYPLADILH